MLYKTLHICSTYECKCYYSFIQFLMKHLYVLMSWPVDMDLLWIKSLSFVSVFCSANLRCSMIVHIFKDKHKMAGDINSLSLLVNEYFLITGEFDDAFPLNVSIYSKSSNLCNSYHGFDQYQQTIPLFNLHKCSCFI